MALMNEAEVEARVRDNTGIGAIPRFAVRGLGPQWVDLRLIYAEGMTRLGDTVSGPMLMATADAAMYAALVAHVPEGERAVTSDLHVDFLRRPAPGDIDARATILRCGRRRVNCRVELFSSDGALVAHVTGAYARTR